MRARRFPESCADFVGLVGLVAGQFGTLLCILFSGMGLCAPKILVVALLQVVQKIGFKHFAGIHMCHEVVQFVGLGDCDPMVLSLDLAPIQLSGEGCYMGIGCVAPGFEEVRLDGERFLGHDDVPHLELLDHRPNILIFITSVVFL